MANSWAVPVGVLAGLASAMFIFICWWFPRHWRKGVTADMREFETTRRRRENAMALSDVEAQEDTRSDINVTITDGTKAHSAGEENKAGIKHQESAVPVSE